MKSSPSVNAREAHLSPEEVQKIDAWWRAVNCRSVGQIYLMNNPPLKEGLSVARHQTPPSRSQGHLNGYKIANPTVLARIPEEGLINVRTYGEDMPEIRDWALAFIKPNLNKRCQ